MKIKYLLYVLMLLCYGNDSIANSDQNSHNINIFSCSTEYNEDLLLTLTQTESPTLNFSQNGNAVFSIPTNESYYVKFLNGDSIYVKKENRWYQFTQFEDGDMGLTVRGAKKGNLVEQFDCEKNNTALIRILDPALFLPMPDELSEFFYKASQ